ncbi:MAG TPA: hypothetical protein VFZ11_03380 [Gemmatimonadaceae bacterium]
MLPDLVTRLRSYADGTISRSELDAWLLPIFVADPLDVAQSDAAGWERAPDETRLFWRLAYLIDSAAGDEAETRRLVGRVVRCLERSRSAATTLELLPLVADQERLCRVVARHAQGIVSRTSFLSLVAESGYPPHVKLWLRHADGEALARLCARLAEGDYEVVAPMLERAPDAGEDDLA